MHSLRTDMLGETFEAALAAGSRQRQLTSGQTVDVERHEEFQITAAFVGRFGTTLVQQRIPSARAHTTDALYISAVAIRVIRGHGLTRSIRAVLGMDREILFSARWVGSMNIDPRTTLSHNEAEQGGSRQIPSTAFFLSLLIPSIPRPFSSPRYL